MVGESELRISFLTFSFCLFVKKITYCKQNNTFANMETSKLYCLLGSLINWPHAQREKNENNIQSGNAKGEALDAYKLSDSCDFSCFVDFT
jgi:hypothetical protein